MEEFFSRLRQEREEKGLSLTQIHEKTRISLQYLDALENGNLKALPKGYDRIFMKAYLKAVGTDVDSFLEEFDRLLGRREPTQVINLEELDREKQIKAAEIPQKIRYLFLWLPVIFILGILFYLFYRYGVNDVKEPSAENIAEIKVEDYLNELDTTQSAIVIPETEERDSLVFTVKGLKKTWIRTIIDRKDTVEFILFKDRKKTLVADSLMRFIIGVGDGVEIAGRDTVYKNLAKAGEIISNLTISREGIRYLIRKKPKTTQPRKENNEE